MRERAARAATIALLLAGGATAHAQVGASLNRAGSGARAAGMGDAFIAVSDDGTAASWNPAGLAQLRQPELSLVYGIADRRLLFSGLRSPDGRLAFSTQRFSHTGSSLEFASAAVPFTLARKPVTVQLGWHRLYQLGANLTGNVQVVPLVPDLVPRTIARDNTLAGDIDLYSAAAALKLTPRLAIGGSFDLWRGDWTERVSLAEEPGAGGPADFYASDASVTVRGHNFSAGLLLTYPRWNLGLVYHSPFWNSYHLRGQASSTLGPPQSVDVPGARFRLPRSVGAGVSYRLAPQWTAAVALTHDRWTDALLSGLPGAPRPVSFFDLLPPELSTTRDTVSLNVGIEHLFLREGSVVPLRLGFGIEPQGGVDAASRDPVTYLLASLGGGYNTNRFKFDAAVQYRWTAFDLSDSVTVDHAVNGGLVPDMVGRATTHEWRIKVSAIYRMPDKETLRRLIGRIFG